MQVSYKINQSYNPYYKYNSHKLAIKQNYGLLPAQPKNINFCGFNPVRKVGEFLKYINAQRNATMLYKYVKSNVGENNFIFRNYNMDILEGIQYGIDIFKGLTMKEIQYLCENLHVIAVKRGCTHMCGHCYADAKPSSRQMSYEEFHSITSGFKKLRKRLHGLDIFSEAIPINSDVEKTTELFYDADCMDLALTDKKGRLYDFTKLSKELYESLGRKTVFDTSGWDVNNKKLQQRAFEYAKYFSVADNMKRLREFNVSFNVFNASYIASRKALKIGDIDKANRLRDKFTTNMANTLYTFTPLVKYKNFNILLRALDPRAKNSQDFNVQALSKLKKEVFIKLNNLLLKDLNGKQLYIKSQSDYQEYINLFIMKLDSDYIDTTLNSSGRMKNFILEHNIKNHPFQEHSKTTSIIIERLKDSARTAKTVMLRLIDTDGKVYHMDYARFIPTEIQLNIKGKNQKTPTLANLVKNFTITRENLNK